MGVVVRTTKNPSGGKTWASGDTIEQAALEDEIASIITQVENIEAVNLATDAVETAKIKDGAVTNAKVSATAAIALSKLDQTGTGTLEALVVDAHADTEAEFATVTAPRVTGGAAALPTSLETELQQIRYALQRVALGTATNGAGSIGPRLTDGSSGGSWFDGHVIGPSILQNGSFLDNNATPFGWTVDGAPATQELSTLPVAEGWGNYLHLADAAGADTDGIDQSIAGVKAGTLYLVEARVLPTTANVELQTTGAATSTFDNLAVPSSGTAWQTISGLVLTDATPTAIEVGIRPDAANYDFGVAWVSMREVASTASTATNEHEGTGSRGGNIIVGATSAADGLISGAATTTLQSDTTVSVVVPDDGYQIVVTGCVNHGGAGGAETWGINIHEDIDAGGYSSVQSMYFKENSGGQEAVGTSIQYHVLAPVPGSIYSYRLSATNISGTDALLYGSTSVHRITVMLMRMG